VAKHLKNNIWFTIAEIDVISVSDEML